jgi:phosphoglycolate phosphatase-like HAD superfamily hydrolase
MAPLVVGFDLDMTLVDSRVGVHATLRALIDETGAPIDADIVVARLGPPLEQELANWVPAEQIDLLADRFRELYVELGMVGLLALPGAAAALDAVRAASGRTLVVTAKYEPNAWRCLEHAGLDVDHVVGWRHGPQKGETLAEHGASVYVGDTPPDMDAAHLAGAIAVAVPTGPFTADDLAAAGADVVLDSLEQFPGWFRGAIVAS